MSTSKPEYPQDGRRVDVGQSPLGQHPPSKPLHGIDAAWEKPAADLNTSARPISHIKELLGDNKSMVDRTHELITEIEERLRCILGPERGDSDTMATVAPRADQSPLADQLDGLCGLQRVANCRLKALIDHLEV